MPRLPASKTNYFASLTPECCYHVYNRTNNRELLFKDEQDYKHFIGQYKHYLSGFVETFAYCLLPNHFHVAIRIKSITDLLNQVKETPESERTVPQRKILLEPDTESNYHPLIERQFTRLFTSYSIYFNNRYDRSGNLFHRPFKRIEITEDSHLHWLIYYIHNNPRKHKVNDNFIDYKWSSYQALATEKATSLNRKAVWEIFGTKALFIAFHTGSDPVAPENEDQFTVEE